MGLTSPNDTVIKIVSLPRWQREWINSYNSLNFSGLVQEVIVELIRQKDPLYYKLHAHRLEQLLVKRKDMIENLIRNNPAIVPDI